MRTKPQQGLPVAAVVGGRGVPGLSPPPPACTKASTPSSAPLGCGPLRLAAVQHGCQGLVLHSAAGGLVRGLLAEQVAPKLISLVGCGGPGAWRLSRAGC